MSGRDPHRLVVVKWRDAHGISSEGTREEVLKAHTPAIYYSAGVLVESDTAGVTLAQDYATPDALNAGTYRTRTFIPRELVEAEWYVGAVVRDQGQRRAPRVRRRDGAGHRGGENELPPGPGRADVPPLGGAPDEGGEEVQRPELDESVRPGGAGPRPRVRR